jgi:hypothetical protein
LSRYITKKQGLPMIYVFQTHPQYTAISMLTVKEKAEKNPTKKEFLALFYINLNLERIIFCFKTQIIYHIYFLFSLCDEDSYAHFLFSDIKMLFKMFEIFFSSVFLSLATVAFDSRNLG